MHALRTSALLAVIFAGCAPSGHQRWDFEWGWRKALTSEARPGKVDDAGVYQPEDPRAKDVFTCPDIHTGVGLEIQPVPRLAPGVGVEVAEMEAPYAGRWSLQAGAGTQLAYVYLGRIVVPIAEITAGPWWGRDFSMHSWAWGVQATVIRF